MVQLSFWSGRPPIQQLQTVANLLETPALAGSLFGRLAELAGYVDGDAIGKPVDRCPSKVQ